MAERASVFTLLIFLMSLGALIFILTSDYIPAYLLAYGVPTAIVSGFALVAFALTVKK